jgi:hypothetical protein
MQAFAGRLELLDDGILRQCFKKALFEVLPQLSV